MLKRKPGGGRKARKIVLKDQDKSDLERWARGRTVSHQLVIRAQIVLAAAQGDPNRVIAQRLHIDERTVWKWRKRFVEGGLAALHDQPRPKVSRRLSDEQVEAIIRTTLETKPEGQTHWSTRQLAKQLGLSQTSISKTLRAFNLKPHKQKHFTLSTDDFFVEKVRDVVGLYMSPPVNALVLCVDEKSQIQALDRMQPVLPMVFGHPECLTHQYLRHGTTTLFAALDIASGKVIAECQSRHRSQEFRKFLNTIKKHVPEDLQIHIVMDNYATHSTPEIQRWLKRNPRFHFHFIPTYSSWLNQVERWFALLTERALRRSVHRSTHELEAAIRAYVEAHNENPQPFIWTKTADQIIASVARYCQNVQVLAKD